MCDNDWQETEGDHYQVDVQMSSTQFKYLKDYVNQRQNSTAEVHSILSEMMHNLRLSLTQFMSCLEALTVTVTVQTQLLVNVAIMELCHLLCFSKQSTANKQNDSSEVTK